MAWPCSSRPIQVEHTWPMSRRARIGNLALSRSSAPTTGRGVSLPAFQQLPECIGQTVVVVWSVVGRSGYAQVSSALEMDRRDFDALARQCLVEPFGL